MNVEIANKLVLLRKKLALSQEELAAKIGVSRQAVSKWERAESSPDTDNLIALSKIYNISLDEMLDTTIDVKSTMDEDLDEDENISTNNNIKNFPYALLVTIIYLAMGIGFGLWHPGWIIFITIPFFHSIVSRKNNKSGDKGKITWEDFPYPILVLIIFLLLGIVFGGWRYAWLVFLTIPIWGYFTVKK